MLNSPTTIHTQLMSRPYKRLCRRLIPPSVQLCNRPFHFAAKILSFIIKIGAYQL